MRLRIRHALLAIAFAALLITIAVQQFQLRRVEAELQKARESSEGASLHAYYRALFQSPSEPSAKPN
jgi:hypothetical protein